MNLEAEKSINALAAALPSLAANDATFAKSLLKQHSQNVHLSEKQWYWVDKLAARAKPLAAPETVQFGTSFAGVVALFAKAAAKLKNPAIVLALVETGKAVRLTLAKPGSKNPGFIYVRLDGVYCGKISPAGCFSPFKLADADRDALFELLGDLAADPAGVASAYGKLTGRCCFCSLKLTDERSVTVGYGPICAGHYDLPWGEK